MNYFLKINQSCNLPDVGQHVATNTHWLRIKRALLILVILLIIKTSASADIAPDPVVGKGIIPLHPVNIQMVSEVVKVDLTLEDAFVECTFNMHNLGKAQDLAIGFPIMNFYLYENDYLSPLGKDRFDVSVKGRKVDKINFYVPDDLKKFLSGVNASQQSYLLQTYKYENRPWYLWKMHFGKYENVSIVVKYRLPNGATHANRFFNYLLSTGAGWKGKIEDAKVIVNTGNIPPDQILTISPRRFAKATEKQITWDFKNFKPTIKDDILIEYESVKGQYKAFEDKLDSQIPTYIDGKLSKHSLVDTSQIGYFEINHHPANGEFAEILFTKTAILQKFKNTMNKTNPIFGQLISGNSVEYFEHNYVFEINGNEVPHDVLFEKLYAVDTTKSIKVEIKKTKAGKKIIVITAH